MKWLIPKKRGQRLVGSQAKGDDSRNSMDDAAFGNFNSTLLDQDPGQSVPEESPEKVPWNFHNPES